MKTRLKGRAYLTPSAPTYFAWRVRCWFAERGIYYCGKCHLWGHDVGKLNKRCQQCRNKRRNQVQALKKAGMWTRQEPPNDWGEKANAYFAASVAKAPTYYTETRLWSSSPQAAQ